jgi:hypothetical protein
MRVQGKDLKLEIDSGAKNCNILSLKTLKEMGIEHNIESSNVCISGVHSEAQKAFGKVTLKCNYKGISENVEFQVLNDRRVDILGRQDSVKFGLIARVHAAVGQTGCEGLVKKYDDVFSDKIGCIPGEYHIKLDPSVSPVVHPPRPVPAPIRKQVQEELQHMEKSGIIVKVTELTDWVSPTVYARKPNGRVRICMDPSNTLMGLPYEFN